LLSLMMARTYRGITASVLRLPLHTGRRKRTSSILHVAKRRFEDEEEETVSFRNNGKGEKSRYALLLRGSVGGGLLGVGVVGHGSG
jgi:hypothetical protein